MAKADPRDKFLFQQDLASLDPDLEFLIGLEEERQARKLIMIASESIAPPAVREAMSSVYNNIYAEGYPSLRMTRFERDELLNYKQELAYHRRYSDRRYYKGTELVDFVEALAMKRCAEAFATPDVPAEHIFANVQPLSGAAANNAVYNSFCQPGDTVMGMSLTHGGHLTHGSPVNRSGRFYHIIPYEANPATGKLDYDQIRKLALEHRPKLIIAGYSAYPWSVDWKAFRAIADEVGAIFMADIAHTAGLIAGKVFPSPIGIAHVITFTTHKTLCGPRGACVLATDPDIADQLEMGVFPGEQGGPHVHTIAAKAVCFKLAQSQDFSTLMRTVVDNAAALAQAFTQRGYKLAYGGTDSHMCLIDLRSVKTPTGYPLSGEIASRLLDLVGITCNKNTIFGDENAGHPSGLRFGTTWVTQRGMRQPDMERIADVVDEVLHNIHSFSYIGLSGLQGRGKIELSVLQDAQHKVEELEHECTTREMPVEEHGYPFYTPLSEQDHLKTPLHAEHERLGAVMGEHHGWTMPLHYGNAQQEIEAAKRGVAIFDRSDTGILSVWGERAQVMLQEAITGDLRRVPLGQSIRTFLLDKDANLIDDITVLYTDRDRKWRDHYIITCNAARVDQVKAWLRGLSDGYVIFDSDDVFAKIEGPAVVEDLRETDVSQRRVMLALQGPKARDLLATVAPAASRLRYRTCLQVQINGISAQLHRAGYTEEDERYELYVDPAQAVQLWQKLMEAGKPFGLRPAGLEARKALHAEAKLPSWEKENAPVSGIDLIRGPFADWVRLSKTYFVGLEPILAQLEPPDSRAVFHWEEPKDAPLKRSALYAEHVRLGASIVPFAGYEMPVRYSSISEEHLAVRRAAGLFDVSHMGVLDVRGEHATAFLDNVLSNYVAGLRPGQTAYAYLFAPDGSILDDLYVYCLNPEHYMVVVNAANEEKDWAWLTAVNERRVVIDLKHPVREIEHPAELRFLKDPVHGADCKVDVALQGPLSLKILLQLPGSDEDKRKLSRLRRTDLCEVVLDGIPLITARTGYTGEKMGFELFVHPEQAPLLWRRLLEVGEPLGLKPTGLGARDSTRTEAGLPLYGHELQGHYSISPAQAGFGSYVKLHKPFFIGKIPVIERRDTESPTAICRFRMDEKGVPAIHTGDPVVDRRGRHIGYVTSCALDSQGYQLGLALIEKRYIRPDNHIGIFPLPRRAGKPEKPKDTLAAGDQVLLHEWATVLTRFPMPGEIMPRVGEE